MSTLSIPKIEVSQEETFLATEINGLPAITKVETEQDYILAVGFLSELKKKEVKVHEFFDDDVSKAHDLHRSLTGKRKIFLDAIAAIRLKVDSLCSAWRKRKEEERLAEERRLQEEAKQKQTDNLLEEAAALERMGDTLGAQCVLAEAQNAPAPVTVVASQVPKVSNSYVKKSWKWRVKDESKIPDEYWTLDESAIGAVVRTKGKQAERMIPGIDIWDETTTITRK